MVESKEHWNHIYETKRPDEVSWTQACPRTSLDFIRSAHPARESSIIDVGGGDSNLVDFLLDEGYKNITVLDISGKALDRARARLGARASQVNWIACDIMEFRPETTYDIWHDRAVFHFLTTEKQTERYAEIARKAIPASGFLIIGTFSMNGPKKCSGLDIKQYSEDTLTAVFQNGFTKLDCRTEDHVTPFNTTQNFLFCKFNRDCNIL
jgi:hypothetical protein